MHKDWILLIKKYTPKEWRFFLRKLRRGALYISQVLFGLKIKKKYYCPINEKNYRTFIKDGKLLLSLHLGARERHRFIWHYLTTSTKLFIDEAKLLHISPEYCFYEKLKGKKNLQYFPADKFEPGYDYLSLTKDFDLLDSEIQTEQFDFIICNHVLEHIVDDTIAITNLFKLLKKDGTAIVSVPILEDDAPTYEDYSIICPKERKLHFGQWDHVRYYGTDIKNRFIDAGFNVKTVNSFDYFNEVGRIRFGVPKKQYLFHLNKS
ncbi:methyltransferase domain-containing protein [Aequorivita todarodis]|uniref:class I SAM-dependent methyltransferase n=1 Tax=Aequorivita todarodis TaxID=2036821 RepID=UPI002350BEA1|nr:methyltransferase domain-containing protein [Aequorivita todarodis]MDC7999628.1 methyltransferase domain-containing protein [Aequorivita todarodis]